MKSVKALPLDEVGGSVGGGGEGRVEVANCTRHSRGISERERELIKI